LVISLSAQSDDTKLTIQGINVQDILKLKASGIVTVLGIAQTPRKNLLKIKVSGSVSLWILKLTKKGLSEVKLPLNSLFSGG